MVAKVIIFAGSPPADSLDWDEARLLKDLEPQIARFAGHEVAEEDEFVPATHPPWRSLPLDRQHLTTGLTQDSDHHLLFSGYSSRGGDRASFFTTTLIHAEAAELSHQCETQQFSRLSATEILSQFYEESYAHHENVISSQIAPALSMSDSSTSDDYTYNTSSFASSLGGSKDIPAAGHVHNIKVIPSATYLNSIQPQTMTVNLIVGIISVSSPRAIRTRRGEDVELIEVLVGDETMSGFSVNFWLSSSSRSEMTDALNQIRPQDVVLIQNVALNHFRGKVYGQSLRRQLTKLHLLYRNRVDKSDIGGCYTSGNLGDDETGNPQIKKTKNVKEWVARFVGVGLMEERIPKGKGRDRVFAVTEEVLPPDTQ